MFISQIRDKPSLPSQVLAVAVDESTGHPLRHAVMAVIAAVAQRDCRLWPQCIASKARTADGENSSVVSVICFHAFYEQP